MKELKFILKIALDDIISAFNRTVKELKSNEGLTMLKNAEAFNRTVKELKFIYKRHKNSG